MEEVLSLVQEAKFILWSGPMGNIEEGDFDKGTKIIAQAIANSKAKTIVGGGDTVAVLNEMGILDKFILFPPPAERCWNFWLPAPCRGLSAN